MRRLTQVMVLLLTVALSVMSVGAQEDGGRDPFGIEDFPYYEGNSQATGQLINVNETIVVDGTPVTLVSVVIQPELVFVNYCYPRPTESYSWGSRVYIDLNGETFYNNSDSGRSYDDGRDCSTNSFEVSIAPTESFNVRVERIVYRPDPTAQQVVNGFAQYGITVTAQVFPGGGRVTPDDPSIDLTPYWDDVFDSYSRSVIDGPWIFEFGVNVDNAPDTE